MPLAFLDIIEKVKKLKFQLPLYALLWMSLGFFCVDDKTTLPVLVNAQVTALQLDLLDTTKGIIGAKITWTYGVDKKVSYFEAYATFNPDSVPNRILTNIPASARTWTVSLPDSSPPYRIQYAIKPIYVENTGQKIMGDSLLYQSLSVLKGFEIYNPLPRSQEKNRQVTFELSTEGDNGQMIRLWVFEKSPALLKNWERTLDTCFPTAACNVPIYGHTLQKDSLQLNYTAQDSLPIQACFLSTESFQNKTVGLSQSLHCTFFYRYPPL